jgi:hypothetical protein
MANARAAAIDATASLQNLAKIGRPATLARPLPERRRRRRLAPSAATVDLAALLRRRAQWETANRGNEPHSCYQELVNTR